RFVIDAATGQLSVAAGASFDFEQAGAHRITVRLTDAAGNTADVQLSIAVSNANDAPTGSVTITGKVAQGETLKASNDLRDQDGLGTVTYQWLRDGQAIEGATGERYTLTQADVGKGLTVRASYVDQFGHAESRTSAATAAVDNANDAPTGSVTLSGTAAMGQVLRA
ncbi:hypothetical protein, partial [Azohydromonas lata]